MKKVIIALSMLVMCLVVQAQERTDKWGVPYVKLNNGVEMPRFGLGTYAVSNDDCKQACLVALKDGYRHIDTAHAYNNENGVGAAIKESGVPREEIWVTSKLWPTEYGEGKTLEAIDAMLELRRSLERHGESLRTRENPCTRHQQLRCQGRGLQGHRRGYED